MRQISHGHRQGAAPKGWHLAGDQAYRQCGQEEIGRARVEADDPVGTANAARRGEPTPKMGARDAACVLKTLARHAALLCAMADSAITQLDAPRTEDIAPQADPIAPADVPLGVKRDQGNMA